MQDAALKLAVEAMQHVQNEMNSGLEMLYVDNPNTMAKLSEDLFGISRMAPKSFLQPPKKVEHVQDLHGATMACQKLREHNDGFIGCDLEWDSRQRKALTYVQFSTAEYCAVFDIQKIGGLIPQALHGLITDESIKKVGANANNDVTMYAKYAKFEGGGQMEGAEVTKMRGTFEDVTKMAREMAPVESPSEET